MLDKKLALKQLQNEADDAAIYSLLEASEKVEENKKNTSQINHRRETPLCFLPKDNWREQKCKFIQSHFLYDTC